MAKAQAQRWYLKQWRKHRGLTQEQLAERAGLSKPFVSQLETGARQYTQETLERLAQVLDTDPAALITRDPGKKQAAWETLLRSVKPEEGPQVAAFVQAIRSTDPSEN